MCLRRVHRCYMLFCMNFFFALSYNSSIEITKEKPHSLLICSLSKIELVDAQNWNADC